VVLEALPHLLLEALPRQVPAAWLQLAQELLAEPLLAAEARPLMEPQAVSQLEPRAVRPHLLLEALPQQVPAVWLQLALELLAEPLLAAEARPLMESQAALPLEPLAEPLLAAVAHPLMEPQAALPLEPLAVSPLEAQPDPLMAELPQLARGALPRPLPVGWRGRFRLGPLSG
jgi:hypothetical protein